MQTELDVAAPTVAVEGSPDIHASEVQPGVDGAEATTSDEMPTENRDSKLAPERVEGEGDAISIAQAFQKFQKFCWKQELRLCNQFLRYDERNCSSTHR